MGLFTQISRVINRINVPQVQQTQSPEKVGKPPVYPAWNIQTYINAYNTNATTYTLMDYVTRKFGNVPRYVYQVQNLKAARSHQTILKQQFVTQKMIQDLQDKAYGETLIKPGLDPVGKLAALTARPNETQGQDSYYADVFLNYELTGETFVYLNRGLTPEEQMSMDPKDIMKLEVLEKKVLPTQWTDVVPTRDDVNVVLKYRFQDHPGHFIDISPACMIHWRKANPNYDGSQGTHLRGQAPLSAGLKILTQDNSATDASVAMQQNQGAKGFIWNANEQLGKSPTQRSQVQEVIDTKFNNTSVKGAVAVLGGGQWGYENLGQSAVDMELVESQKQVMIKMCNLFGIPPELFSTEQTYENLQQAAKSLLYSKVLPAACSFRDEENRMLLPSFGLDPTLYTIDIDATMMPELAEDMNSLVTSLALQTWKTPNEKRVAMGEELMDDPAMDKIYMPTTLTAIDNLSISDGLDSFDPNEPGESGSPSGASVPDKVAAKPKTRARS